MNKVHLLGEFSGWSLAERRGLMNQLNRLGQEARYHDFGWQRRRDSNVARRKARKAKKAARKAQRGHR